MGELTRDGMAEAVSREVKFSGAHRGQQGKIMFPVELTSSTIGNHNRLMHSLLKEVMTYLAVRSSIRIHSQICY